MFYQSFVILSAFYPAALTVSRKSSIHFLPCIPDGEADALGGILFCVAGSTSMRYNTSALLTAEVISMLAYSFEFSVLRFRPLIARLFLGGEAVEV